MNYQLLQREDTQPRVDLEQAREFYNKRRNGKSKKEIAANKVKISIQDNFEQVKANLELHRLCRAVDKISNNKTVIDLCKERKDILIIKDTLHLKYFGGDKVSLIYYNWRLDTDEVVDTYLWEHTVDMYVRNLTSITTDDELYKLVNEAIIKASTQLTQSELKNNIK